MIINSYHQWHWLWPCTPVLHDLLSWLLHQHAMTYSKCLQFLSDSTPSCRLKLITGVCQQRVLLYLAYTDICWLISWNFHVDTKSLIILIFSSSYFTRILITTSKFMTICKFAWQPHRLSVPYMSVGLEKIWVQKEITHFVFSSSQYHIVILFIHSIPFIFLGFFLQYISCCYRDCEVRYVRPFRMRNVLFYCDFDV